MSNKEFINLMTAFVLTFAVYYVSAPIVHYVSKTVRQLVILYNKTN